MVTIYKSIEKHELHERTYCLSYHMCIRTASVIEYLKISNHTDYDINFNLHLMKNIYLRRHMEEFMFLLTKEDLIDTQLSTSEYRYIHENNIFSQYKEIYKLDEKNKLFESRSLLPGNIKRSSLKVDPMKYFPNTTTKLPYIPSLKNKKRKITIDFALPINEISAYIEKVKTNFTSDPTAINSQPEKEKNEHKELYSIRTSFVNKKKRPSFLNQHPEKLKQYQYADMFFIYDVLSSTKDEDEELAINYIQDELAEYYIDFILKPFNISILKQKYINNNPSTTEENVISKMRNELYDYLTSIEDTTIKNYYKIIKPYIENNKYKTLLV